MPTAIEYGLMTPSHAQNGAGSGPPAQNKATEIQSSVAPTTPADEWLFTGPLTALLLVAAIAAAVRRVTNRSSPSESATVDGRCPLQS